MPDDEYILQYTGSEVDAKLVRPVSVSDGGTGNTVYSSIVADISNDTTTFSNHSIVVRYYPYLQLCRVRAEAKIDHKAVSQYTDIDLATIPEAYRPERTNALSCTMYHGGQAKINSSGIIKVTNFAELQSTGEYIVYVTGWWPARNV
jgi:hypothetical protein